MIGGSSGGKYLNTCLRFDLAGEAWEQMPSMQVARQQSSSCFLSGNLYAFCGLNGDKGLLQSIEKLRVFALASEQKQQAWQLIPEGNFAADFSPRCSLVACPLNSTQILIMGGRS